MLTWTSMNVFAQDYRKMSIDSLRAEILKKLNDKTWNMGDVKAIGFRGDSVTSTSCKKINKWEAINITEDSLFLKIKERIMAFPLKSIIYNSRKYIRKKSSECIDIGRYQLDRYSEGYKLLPWLMSLSNRSETDKYDKELTEFQKLAKNYNELNEKPAITEEQRKYIVQANMANEKKDYKIACQLFQKAIEISPTTYPAAYYNLALLDAMGNDFRQAIFNMKKYLLLVPDAPDTRAAQDKIYEWEFEIEKDYNYYENN